MKAIKTVNRSPDLNSFVEHYVKANKRECLDHLILTSEKQLRYVVGQFEKYYIHERPHEGLGVKLIDPYPQEADGEIVKFERLCGLLKSYRRVKEAA